MIVFALFFSRSDLVVAESTAFIYNDPFWVDLKIGDGGARRRYDLYRDSVSIKTWLNPPDTGVYHSDVPGHDQVYYYQVKYYIWDDEPPQWVPWGSSSEIRVDTHYVLGRLHNNEEWQQRFVRGAVFWSADLPYRVTGEVEIVDGTLEIVDGANVIFSSNWYHNGGDIIIGSAEVVQ